VSALLRSWSLVLNVYSSRSFLDEQLRELHHCGQSTVSSIRIRDDGAQVVDVCELGAVSFGFRGYTFFALLAVMEKLGHEKVGDFVWDGGLGILALAFGEVEEDGRRGNLPNLDLARRMQRR